MKALSILIRNARPLPFRPCRGQLGFFSPDFTPPAIKAAKVLIPRQAAPASRQTEIVL